jgi:adenylate cyclase
MTPATFRRKLAAILSADVAGYSRLMQDDEAATVRTLEAYRQIISYISQQHRGRVVDSPGDNLLAEFTSVVDAVQCAVAVQKELQARNRELPEDRRMQFRIGVNLGDVIEEGGRIYGDGVNIAARLESLADPGGVCISKTAFDQIETKLPLGYEFLGEQTVKNIAKPVGAYRVVLEPRVTKRRGAGLKVQGKGWRLAFYGLLGLVMVTAAAALWQFVQRPSLSPVEMADPKKMAYPLPDKPSIAVMPFLNMTGDQNQEFICIGMSESLITALSKVPQLFVIARDSTLSYRGKTVKVAQASEELGVQYVLEGSILRAGDRLRVTAQLIDTVKGHHLWAERYDREPKDLFGILDDITKNIVTALHINLTWGESARMLSKGTENIEAYLKVFEALWYTGQTTRDGLNRARQLADEAVFLDPKFPTAYFVLGVVHMLEALTGFSKNPEESNDLCNKMLHKAIELDESFAIARATLGYNLAMLKRYDEALSEVEQAYELAPNTSQVLYFYGTVLNAIGRHEEALPPLKEALRIDPIPPNARLRSLGSTLGWGLQRYDEAIAYMRRAVQREPNDILSQVILTSLYSMAGRDEEAGATAKEVLRINPKFSGKRYITAISMKDPRVRDRIAQSLQKAGLSDQSGLPLPDKPSIAVLAFTNMSDDPKQEVFSDGLTEDLITALSKVPNLFVIARNSTFAYKGKPVKVQQVAEDLGVRYVLEGSIQKAGDRVRITVQLIDALKGHHVWSERYDQEIKDVFALQDRIALETLKALDVKLSRGEAARIHAKGTDNLEAYIKFLQGRELVMLWNKESNVRARQLAEEAISLDPNYPIAYHLLSVVTANDVWLGISKFPTGSLMKAIELEQKAIDMDDACAPAYAILGNLYAQIREYDKGIAAGERAIEIAPNLADAYAHFAHVLNLSGRPDEAIPLIEKAFRLNPVGPGSYYYFHAANSYRLTGRHEDAVKILKELLSRWPDNLYGHIELTINYTASGRDKEASEAVKSVLRIDPKFSGQKYAQMHQYKDPALTTQVLGLLRKAGLPD